MRDDKELQNAIDHAREIARLCMWRNPECARDHKQLAKWLEELQCYRKSEWGIEK